MSQSAGARDPEALRAQFDAEVRAANLVLLDRDREVVFAMWANQLALRDRLRAEPLTPEEEPSLIEKPALLGGGVTPPAASSTPGGAA
ncbi:MAG: hypothetical protein IT305_32895 [Chloroflexi bacterium]|nr:hypothetical protein [Chloroflexota bacterium]